MTAALLYGCAGPFVVALVSWFAMKRAYLANRAGLMPVLLAGMGIKLVFFAAYATVMLRIMNLPPVPFVASFASSFIVCHNVEAYFMKRLFASA